MPGPLVEQAFRHCWLSSLYEHELIGEPELGESPGRVPRRAGQRVPPGRRPPHVESTARPRMRRLVAERAVETRTIPRAGTPLVAPGRRSAGHLPVRELFAQRAGRAHRAQAVLGDEPAGGQPAAAGRPAVLRRRHLRRGQPGHARPTRSRRSCAAERARGRRRRAPAPADRPSSRRRPTRRPRTRTTMPTPTPSRCAGRRASSRSSTSRTRCIGSQPCSRWHYRSRDERLIAFSNAHDLRPVRAHHLPGRRAATTCLTPRARATRARRGATSSRRPRRSTRSSSWSSSTRAAARTSRLGVIAMGIKHADRIRRPCAASRAEHEPELDAFFAEDRRRAVLRQEPRARPGRRARRDHPLDRLRQANADGRLRYRFGPLNQRGRRAPPQRRDHPGASAG